jgi:peptidoglycan hydrolase-like protein with peptidoglycan-binding domain
MERAVLAFQKTYGMRQDGIVDAAPTPRSASRTRSKKAGARRCGSPCR